MPSWSALATKSTLVFCIVDYIRRVSGTRRTRTLDGAPEGLGDLRGADDLRHGPQDVGLGVPQPGDAQPEARQDRRVESAIGVGSTALIVAARPALVEEGTPAARPIIDHPVCWSVAFYLMV
jgi:hypothetical protein